MPRKKTGISRKRVELIAKAHACEHCGEYSYKKLTVRPAAASVRKELRATWNASKICGVCGLEQEMGIADDGEIIYLT